MKKLLLIIAILAVMQSVSFAQYDTVKLKKVCDYDTFPIGAIRNWGHDTLEQMFGMNFGWYGWGPEQDLTFPMQTPPANDTVSSRDPFYYDSTVNYQTYYVAADGNHGYNGLLNAASQGKDVRVYMPGTSGITSEYNYGWNHKSGGLDSLDIPQRRFEWIIRGDTLPLGYVLDTLNGGAQNDPYSCYDPNHIGTVSYEFVYFFNSGDLSGVSSGTTPLYSIEYWVKKSGSANYTRYLADTITRNSYNALSFAITQVPGRKVGAEQLDNWAGVASNIHYRIQKHILRIDTFYVSGAAPQVDVRIRNFQKIPIFVRCLRIRDWVAQRLLTGKADSAMGAAIGLLLNYNHNNELKSWSVWNEPFVPTFHCISYLNDLFVKNGAPVLNTLAPWDNDVFIRVARDQSENIPGKPKMILWHEWGPYTGMYWYVNYGDHYDWDYNNYPRRPLLPITFANQASPSSDSADWEKRAIFFESNYATFTNFWQNTVIGYSSNAPGGGKGYMSNLLSIAQACYELDPVHPVPYYGCYSAMASPIHGAPLWVVDSLRLAKKIADTLTDAAANHWADSLYEAKYVNPYFTRNHLTKDSVIVADSLYHLYWDWRASTEAEVRSQLWTGICHGLKGYSANAAMEDIGANDGFLWDHDGVITKSYDRTEMRLDYFTGGSLTRPYGTGHFRNDTVYKIKSKLLPAFKGMYNAVKDAVTLELGPIAPTLAVLNWKGSVSWHKRDSTPTYLSRLPIKNLHAKTLRGVPDPDSTTYVQCGIHKHPTDSFAVYVSFLNRRLWTDEKDTLTTDYRTISFQVDTTKFDLVSQKSNLWNISDISGKLADTAIPTSGTYSFTVKPGQGKLFRIAPASGLDLGRLADNLYNNGRHIAAIDTSVQGGIKQYVMTYARNGKICVSYPVETPANADKRKAGAPVDSVIYFDTASYNPSVAYNHADNSIGITWRKVVPHNKKPLIPGAGNDTTWICFSRANYANPYQFSPMKVLDTLITNYGYIAPPAIAPRDTSFYNLLNASDFWVAYNCNDSGETLVLVNTNDVVTRKIHFWAPDRQFVYHKFVSIATHVPYDSVQISFEEGLGNEGQIYYTIGYIDAVSGALQITPVPPLNISGNLNTCENHCPQTGMTPDNTAEVVWEAIQRFPVNPPDTTIKMLRHYSVLRTRGSNGSWSDYTTFRVRSQLLTIADPPYTSRIYVNIASGSPSSAEIGYDLNNTPWQDWKDLRRMAWNNLMTGSVELARFGFFPAGARTWRRFHYPDLSWEPSMPTLSYGNRTPHVFSYRSTVRHEDGLFDARISRYPFPVDTSGNGNNFQVISAFPDSQICNKPVINAKMGNVSVTTLSPAGVKWISFHSLSDSANDPHATLPISWNDKKGVRTFTFHISTGDTLKYQREFTVGAYLQGDTAKVSDRLKGTNDFLLARIYLRRAADDSIVAILDSARLKKSGFIQSGSFSDSGWNKMRMASSDSVYLTMEMARGDTTNPFILSHIDAHGDDFYESFTVPDNSSFKKAFPDRPISHPAPSGSPGEIIKVTVVPNPFQTSTQISLDVPKDVLLNISLFDLLGRPVLELFNDIAGKEHYDFMLTNDKISQGIYLLRVQSGDKVVTRKIQLLK